MKNNISICLSQLLPYNSALKKSSELKNSLKEYQALLKILLEISHALKSGCVEKFDGLVGENACHIRTIWMCLIASSYTHDIFYSPHQIVKSINQINSILNTKKIENYLSNKKSLQEILEIESLDIVFSESCIFVFQSYVLTKIKIIKNTESTGSIFRVDTTDPKQLGYLGDVSSSFWRRLVNQFRKDLAEASVQFTRKHAMQIQDRSLMQMVSEDLTHVHNGFACVPIFWAYKTMLITAQKNDIPIVIHAKFLEDQKDQYVVANEHFLFFKVSSEGRYVVSSPEADDLVKPACIIQGLVAPNKNGRSRCVNCWKEQMLKIGVEDLTLAAAADHRQYPDASLDETLIQAFNNPEYEKYKALAKNEGFSADNPKTF